MTRMAICSDSHGGRLHLERFAEYCRREGVQQVCHLGDVVEDAKWLRETLEIPVALVSGNCDFYSKEAKQLCFRIEGKRFLLLHGDRLGVKVGYDRLSYYAEEQRADVALFGHTHRPFAAYVGKALLVNPGALKDGVFCLMEVSKNDIIPCSVDLDQWWRENIQEKE